MSNKPRTEAQKKRRAYVEKCRKEGKKPLPMDKWSAEPGDSKKEPKKVAKAPVKKDAKKDTKKSSKKPSVKGKVVTIRRGDEVHFDDYTSEELAEFARGVIRLAIRAFSRGC